VRIGVDRADVPPVGVLLAIFVSKREGLHGVGLGQPRQQVVAEVVPAAAVGGVPLELLEQEVGGEAVDAHRGQGQRGVGWIGGRIGHLFAEAADAARPIDLHRAELAGFLPPHGQRPDGDVRPARLVGLDQ
jgi:hypothetical protein